MIAKHGPVFSGKSDSLKLVVGVASRGMETKMPCLVRPPINSTQVGSQHANVTLADANGSDPQYL